MTSFDEIVARRRHEAESLRGVSVSEIRPSTRDAMPYLTTGREGLSVVADLSRRDPSGRHPPREGYDLRALAGILDDAEVDSVAIGTDPVAHGASLDDLRAISESFESLPVIRRDWVFTVAQVHESRLHGADALVLLPALLDPMTLRELVRAAATTHMATVAHCWDEAGLARALEAEVRVVELSAVDPRSGARSLDGLRRLAETVPAHLTTLATGDLTEAEAKALAGAVDGVVLGEALLGAEDPAAVVGRIKEA
jgi:indole-3-glycerol phosphate synthase